MSDAKLTDIVAKLRHETERAFLIFDGAHAVWLPKSQCEIELGKNMTCIVTLPEWLAREKGLI
jgi:hypothetical protein